MRILVLNPPFHKGIIREGRCQSPQSMRKNSVPQITIAYLASMLKNGNDLRVYDCIAVNMSEERLFDQIEDFSPEVAFLNTTTPSIDGDLSFTRNLKARWPECFVALFGTHVTALHKEIMEAHEFLDCIIRHEPEWTAKQLVDSLQAEGVAKGEVTNCTIRRDGQVIVSETGRYNDHLDSLSYPDWNQLPVESYIHPLFGKPYLMVNTSRGCVHNCVFCVANLFYGKKVRFRSVESVLDEIENHVIGKFGVHHVWMYADDFTRSPDFVKELCIGIIERKLDITWWSNTRVDQIDVEMFRLMKKAGCFMLSIGGESGNAGILKAINKGTKPEDIKETVRVLRKVGITSLVYFLIGLPGETRETLEETVRFAREINPDYVEFYPATPYPGTRFYEIASQSRTIADDNWENYMCGGDSFVIKVRGMSEQELQGYLSKAYRRFYFRPAYAATLMKRMMKPAEFIRLIGFGLAYMKRFRNED